MLCVSVLCAVWVAQCAVCVLCVLCDFTVCAMWECFAGVLCVLCLCESVCVVRLFIITRTHKHKLVVLNTL